MDSLENINEVARSTQPSLAAYTRRLENLRDRWSGLEVETSSLLAAAIEEFGTKLALTSSFGSESVVELHMLSQLKPSLAVIFLNTGKLFGETLRYRDELKERFGLSNIRSISPDEKDRHNLDKDGTLWSTKPDLCCHFRKTLPQERALEGFEAIITGRKRFQTRARQNIPFVDLVKRAEGFEGFRFVINPLADWTFDQINAYIEQYDLPRHRLVKEGYLSIGCMPCTDRSTAADYRGGRWAGLDKEECGIHAPSLIDGEGI